MIWDNCKEIVYTTRRVQNPLPGYVFDGPQKWTSWLKGLCHRPRGTAGNSWRVYAARSNPDPISEKKNVIFHTRFQTWSLKSIPWKRVTKRNITCLHKTEIMSSLLRLKPPQNDLFNTISNSHITLSFLFIWIETTNKLIHNRSSFVNHTRFPTKMGKIYTRFQTKTAQNLYPFGGTYVSGSYKGVPLPPPPPPAS